MRTCCALAFTLLLFFRIKREERQTERRLRRRGRGVIRKRVGIGEPSSAHCLTLCQIKDTWKEGRKDGKEERKERRDETKEESCTESSALSFQLATTK